MIACDPAGSPAVAELSAETCSGFSLLIRRDMRTLVAIGASPRSREKGSRDCLSRQHGLGNALLQSL